MKCTDISGFFVANFDRTLNFNVINFFKRREKKKRCKTNRIYTGTGINFIYKYVIKSFKN